MNEEVWKILDNFLNYEISSYGNLRNKTTNNTFNPCIKSGYLGTSLKHNENEICNKSKNIIIVPLFFNIFIIIILVVTLNKMC